MSRRKKLLALFVLAAVVAFIIPRSLTTESPEPKLGASLKAEGDEIALVSPDKIVADRVGRLYVPRSIEYQPTVTAEEDHQYTVVLDTETSFSGWLEEQRNLVKTASPEDIEERRQQAESGDVESAFWMFLYFDHCRNAPKVEWQLDRELRSIQRILDSQDQLNPRVNVSIASIRFDKLEQDFRICSIFGPEFDFTSAALDWLELAADMGHMGAQRRYQGKAHELLTSGGSPLAFQKPDLIYEFKDRSDTYAQALLRSDHPLGLLLMARMLNIGDVYERDPVMAFAYAHAAELVGSGGILEDAKQMKSWIESGMPPDQIPKAKKLAREILDER